MVEFGAAMVILILSFTLPLLDFGMIPIHWMLSQEIVTKYTSKLAVCQSFSQALAMLDADNSMIQQLSHLGGVTPQSTKCLLVISKIEPPLESFIADCPKTIPVAWLPGGAKSPCNYEIHEQYLSQ